MRPGFKTSAGGGIWPALAALLFLALVPFFYATSVSQISQLFGGYYNFMEAVALAPWAFWAAQKARQESSWFAWGLCGAVFALQILSTFVQLFAYTLPAVAFMYETMCGTSSMPLRSHLRIADAMGRRRQDWYDLFSARYIFVHSQDGSAEPGDTVTVYGNRGAFPRAWLAGSVQKVPGDEDAYRLLADPRFNPRERVALTEDPGLAGRPPKGLVRWIESSPQACALAACLAGLVALFGLARCDRDRAARGLQ